MIIPISDIDEDKRSKIEFMNGVLGVDELDTEVYLLEDSPAKILNALAARNPRKPMARSTKCQYFSAVHTAMHRHGVDCDMYLTSRIPKQETTASDEIDLSVIRQLLTHKDKAIRLLAGTIEYGVDAAINLERIIATSVIERDEWPFLDIENGTWTIYPEREGELTYAVDSKFLDLIRDISGEGWLLEHKGMRAYGDTKKLSRDFNNALKKLVGGNWTYLRVRQRAMSMRPKPVVESKWCKPASLIINIDVVPLEEERVEDPREMCELFNDEPLLTSSDLERVSDISKEQYCKYALQLQSMVIGKCPLLLVDTMCSDETYNAVVTVLDKLNPNTACMYITALSRILEAVPNLVAARHSRYRQLANKYKLLSAQLPKKEVVPFDRIMRTINRLYRKPGISISMNVIMLILKHSINDDEFDIGMLRASDLIHTSLGFNPDYSYVDFEQRLWHIRETCTKNKRERKLELSQSFVDELGELYEGMVPQWLVFREKDDEHMLSKYTKTDSLTSMFSNMFHCGMTDVRASYVTYMNNRCTIAKCRQLAKNMGHRYTTAIYDYLALVINDDDSMSSV